MGIESALGEGYLTTRLDKLINWGRANAANGFSLLRY